MAHPFSQLAPSLDDIAQQGLYRSRRIIESPQGINLEIDGKNIVNFCSNDYLGLANHPDVLNAFKTGADHYGVGSGSAHLICGHSGAHHALEEELAAFTGRDRALLFSTGYMANIGVISALLGRGDAVFEDRLNHASLLDGGLLSGARFKRYAHADAADLSVNLEKASGNKLVVTDGVFSMDGDFAPLNELAVAAKNQGAWLMVDDAHGLGVIGEYGGGIVEHYGLGQDDVPVLMGTLGKGFGTFGAFVAGSEVLIETLIQKARTYVYTTALPAAVAEATRASLKIVISESWRRDKLKKLSERFRVGAEQLGLQVMPSSSAIQPILIGDSQRAVDISNALLEAGFLVSAIRPPTVPQGSARLRVTFSALHEEQHVDRLLDALAKIIAGRK
ncbi:8-amino-7-oxononanoate synthase [Methylobacter sp.]|uniref:8-amino-7-oxononanoate synthase n=1 Tax=Methylobacter sp. TaxID=2051955 RepID=UPI002489B163|nr:8-amino-7-oxononanoate synthase [Methylobacter sp.]MDI1277488.1 8-amino-7-oxononanoate synthase [Methylobacter sp.]MDI1358053.1 8-amino-7-oxononanoate synthase [Methylobacter sp.]